MSELIELAERVEAASGADRELDALIWCVVGKTDGGNTEKAWRNRLPMGPDETVNGMKMAEAIERFPKDLAGAARAWNVPPLTASIDAALSLVPEGWRLHSLGEQQEAVRRLPEHNSWWAVLVPRSEDQLGYVTGRGDAATPALALVSCALRARAALTTGDGE